MKTPIQKAAALLGRKGGLAKSEAKTAAARENARKAGRKPFERGALIYRVGAEWRCETQGIGHHAGGDSRMLPTRREAEEYARSKKCTPRRVAGCDTV